MRVLLSTYGSRGDVEPFAALSVRLKELGAEVRVCAPPEPEFERRFGEVGVEMLPLGQSARELVKNRAAVSADLPKRAAEFIAAQMAQVGSILEAGDGCDLVVATGLVTNAAGSRSVAEKLGIPAVYATFQQVMLPSPFREPPAYPGKTPPGGASNRQLWEFDAASQNELFGVPLNEHRAALGLPPVHDIRSYYIGERPLLATDPVLDPWREPSELEVVQTGAWKLPDHRPLPPGLEEFLRAGAAPIYVGFGSMGMHGTHELSRAVVEAVRARGHRVVLSRGWAELDVVDDGEDCFVVGEANHDELFRRAAAVVHHGGAGTTTAAARAGAPQVVVPQLADQPYWATRVADLGIGVAHDGAVPTRASLSAALERALAPETAERAAEVAAELRADGALEAAQHLLSRASRT